MEKPLHPVSSPAIGLPAQHKVFTIPKGVETQINKPKRCPCSLHSSMPAGRWMEEGPDLIWSLQSLCHRSHWRISRSLTFKQEKFFGNHQKPVIALEITEADNWYYSAVQRACALKPWFNWLFLMQQYKWLMLWATLSIHSVFRFVTDLSFFCTSNEARRGISFIICTIRVWQDPRLCLHRTQCHAPMCPWPLFLQPIKSHQSDTQTENFLSLIWS